MIREFAHLLCQLSETRICCYFHKPDSEFVSSCQSQTSAADFRIMGVIVCCIILHSDCLGPSLVTGRNEVAYGKWIPVFSLSLSLFTIPFGCLHTAARHTHWSSAPLPLGLFCSLAISHNVTMSYTSLSGTSIAVMEERISGRQDSF